MNKEQTPIEWLEEHIKKVNWIDKKLSERMDIIKRAKEMEKTMVTEYAEFCVRCDRAGLPLVKFEDWIKELTFKSEEQ